MFESPNIGPLEQAICNRVIEEFDNVKMSTVTIICNYISFFPNYPAVVKPAASHRREGKRCFDCVNEWAFVVAHESFSCVACQARNHFGNFSQYCLVDESCFAFAQNVHSTKSLNNS